MWVLYFFYGQLLTIPLTEKNILIPKFQLKLRLKPLATQGELVIALPFLLPIVFLFIKIISSLEQDVSLNYVPSFT